MKPEKNIITYKEVFQSLRERIFNGTLTGRIPSLAMLRAEYGVSGDTVKKAVALLKEHRFVYGHQGKGVFINHTGEVNPFAQKTVALYANEMNSVHPFIMCIVDQMRRLLEKEHCNFIYLNSVSQIAVFEAQFDVLVLCSQFDEGWPEEVIRIDPKKVISCNCRQVPGGYRVGSDNVRGGFLATQWLYSKGCRSIGVLGETDILDETSYIHMREHGARLFASMHRDVALHHHSFASNETSPYADAVIEQLFADRPDGVFLTLDMMAFRVYDWCCKHRIGIGTDVHLIGFDDSVFCEQLVPPLTSMREDHAKIAHSVIDMIRCTLCGNSLSEKENVPPAVIDRSIG